MYEVPGAGSLTPQQLTAISQSVLQRVAKAWL